MDTVRAASAPAYLGRITWMLVGPLLLVVAGVYIVDRGTGWVTTADVVFFTILAAMMLGRWLEFRYGKPLTASGEPATPGHLRRYVLLLALFGVGVWVFANVLGNHLLAG